MSESRMPRIWVVGFSLSGFLPEIIPDFAAQADIRLLNKLFEEGEQDALELLAAGEADVFIAAGANGAWLRGRLPAPVVLIKVTGFDILHALMQARAVSERIAIFSYQTISAELEEVKELLRLDIEQCFYTTPDDARERVQQLAAAGFRVIVGSSMINRLAREAGLEGVFLYTPNSVRQAVEDAIEIARLGRIEEARREWLNSILLHLDEAVAAVDRHGLVQSLNPAMADLLAIPVEWAVGRPLADLAPELSLAETLRSGTAELDRIQRLGRHTLVVNRLPLHERGTQTGAVLTCRDAGAIERADRSLRQKARSTRFFARYELPQMIGASPAMRQVHALAERYARTDATVLIGGESGTGKELLAQGIHNESRRRRNPFVAINCAAFPETLLESELFGFEEGTFTGARRGGKAGLFEAAHTGTLFLDEIGEMPLALQTRLLRVLQEKEVLRLGAHEPTPIDVRIIAATHCDLPGAIHAGRFREDLYYRLNILQLNLPPLRERPGDIGRLAEHLLAGALRRHHQPHAPHTLLREVLPILEAHDWPGNVRELENVIERIAVFCSDLPRGAAFAPEQLCALVPELCVRHAPVATPARIGREAERAWLEQQLTACHGNRSELCRRLGISRTTLWRRLGRSD